MEFKLNVTAGQVIATIGIALLCFGLGYFTHPTQETQDVVSCDYNGFTPKDLNYLFQASYLSGSCERLGLQTSIMVQDYNGTPYGIPVCVEGVKNAE